MKKNNTTRKKLFVVIKKTRSFTKKTEINSQSRQNNSEANNTATGYSTLPATGPDNIRSSAPASARPSSAPAAASQPTPPTTPPVTTVPPLPKFSPPQTPTPPVEAPTQPAATNTAPPSQPTPAPTAAAPTSEPAAPQEPATAPFAPDYAAAGSQLSKLMSGMAAPLSRLAGTVPGLLSSASTSLVQAAKGNSSVAASKPASVESRATTPEDKVTEAKPVEVKPIEVNVKVNTNTLASSNVSSSLKTASALPVPSPVKNIEEKVYNEVRKNIIYTKDKSENEKESPSKSNLSPTNDNQEKRLSPPLSLDKSSKDSYEINNTKYSISLSDAWEKQLNAYRKISSFKKYDKSWLDPNIYHKNGGEMEHISVDPSKPIKGMEYKHLDLSTPIDVSPEVIDKIFEDHEKMVEKQEIKEMTERKKRGDNTPIVKKNVVLLGKGKVFIDAAKKYNINVAYLVAHAIAETGYGRSNYATGVKELDFTENGKKVKKRIYNFFGVGVYDLNTAYGAEKAREQNWTTPEAAIYGGAKFISENYIHRKDPPKARANEKFGAQNTLYKMKWNPKLPGVHQYASDPNWPETIALIMKKIIDKSPKTKMKFDIPEYKK
ncbi:mannosyl-glycoprotein endo-beta-N-acetylglucosaminidase [Erwinia sp. AG740]|nr:mannosyl-glycoprotein endo-beta-N-acetylglucosaminidase [Erwinia sp. AG740]